MAQMARRKANAAAAPAAAKTDAPPRVLEGAVAAPNLKAQVKTGRKVIVCCKMPNGLILRLQQKQRITEQTLSGTREVDIWVDKPGSPKYIVAGNAYPRLAPKGYPKQVPIEGGYAQTRGVPAEFWEEWVKQNELADYVVNGTIFAMTDIDDVVAQAREQEGFQTGLQPLEVGEEKITDYRLPKPKMPHIYYTEEDARKQRAS